MKILQINSVYKKGSTGNIVFDIHSFLKENNVESYVCYGRGPKINEKNVFKTSSEFSAKINKIWSKITGYVYGGNFSSTRKLIRKIKQIEPDIIHIHNLNDYFVNEYKLLKFIGKNRIKTIFTLHSEQMYTGSCGYALDCLSWCKKGCKKCPHIKLSTGTKIDKTNKAFNKLSKAYKCLIKDNLKVIGCTPWLEERAKKSVLLSMFDCKTILNGSDNSIYKLSNNSLKKELNLENKKILLYVCPRMLDPIKGYKYIKDISDKLTNDWQIVVIGKQESNIYIAKNITYIGEIKNKEILSKYYNMADATLILSMRECFPMVIVESVLCGTPVVGFKCYGPDNAYPETMVKLFEYGNVNKIISHINDKFNKKEIARLACTMVSSKVMCKNYLDTYLEFLK